MGYRILGPVEASADEGRPVQLGGPKQRLVLALLLVDADRVVSDDRLSAGVWGEDPPGRPRHIIQTYVSELRKLLDDEIRREGTGYRLVVDRDAVDAHRFESLVASGRERLADAPAGAAALLREALALWHGSPYADLAHAPVLQPEIHRLEQARLVAVEERIRADAACGRHAEVAAELEALTREHPYREGLRGLQMRALYQCGRQADALRVYERTRDLLAEELGIDPSPGLQELHRRILAQDPALDMDGEQPLAPSTVSTPLAAGAPFDVIRGFELRERLGEGDFGTTYRAYQAAIGREVVLKVVPHGQASRSSFVHSFESRARQVAQLSHPHLVTLLDYWRDPEAVFVVTPWFPAGDAQRTLRTGPWSLAAALRLLDQVGSALAAAHQHGVIHGDVKSRNVLMDPDGNTYLSDFPVTPRVLDAGGARATATPAELTPEERLGRPLTPRSDVHALARLTVELLAGSAPDPEAPVEALARSRPDLPSQVTDVLRHATAADPAGRPDRVEDLLRELRRAAGADVVGPPAAKRAGSLRNPYKGLQAFREQDAQDFFGREAAIERLIEAVRDHRLVAVVGPSGSGKSSLVHAGLLPALRSGALPGSGDWLVTEMYPGSYPFEELEAALLRVAVERPDGMLAELLSDHRGMLRIVKQILPRDDSELVLVIDQFEELFSLTADPQLRRLFLDGLVSLSDDGRGRVRIVLTLRGDFFDRPLEHHEFGELLRAGLVPVTVPAPEELMRAVVQPARHVGAEFEEGLVARVVRDVADQPGGLPLLQHALTELFARRAGTLLTAEAYDGSGGVVGALGRRAEELYQSLPAPAQETAQQVFLRLVSVDEQTEDARRRVRRSEFSGLSAEAAVVDDIIRRFGAHRLVTFDRDPVTRTPTIEVAHEALFRKWDRLRGWIDAHREDLLLHRRLIAAVAEWNEQDRADDYLLAAGRLEHFQRWAETTPISLTEGERVFLQASRAHEDAVAAARRRRRTALMAGAIAAAILGLVLAGLALAQQGRAARGERVALARALAAESRGQSDADHDLSVLLALEAVETTREVGEPAIAEAVQALHDAVRGHRLEQTGPHGGFLVHFLGDGERMLAAGPPQNQPIVWDLRSGEQVVTVDASPHEPTHVAVSADGGLLAQTYVGRPVTVWDLDTGQMIAELDAAGAGQWQGAFSPDGGQLAFLDDLDGRWALSIWDVVAETEVASAPTTSDPSSVAFSPDGQLVAVSDVGSSAVWVHDADTLERVATVGQDDPSRGVSSIAFDPSGRLVMYLSEPSEIQVAALDEVDPQLTLPVGADPNTLCVTGDGTAIAATAADETVRVWDADAGDLLLTLPGTSLGGVLDCGPDGQRIATATPDGTTRVWDITTAGSAEVRTIPTPRPWDAAWTSDGTSLLSTHEDGSLRRHGVSSGRLESSVLAVAPFPSSPVITSPDGRFVAGVAAPAGDGPPDEGLPGAPASVVIHDASTLEQVRELEEAGQPIGFAEDGALLLATGVDRPRLLDVQSGEVVWEATAPDSRSATAPIASGAMLADGTHAVVTAVGVPEAWVLDLARGDLVAVVCLFEPARRVAVSPDGGLLAVAGPSTVGLWDLGFILERGPDVDCGTGDPASGPDAPTATFVANAWIGMGFSPDSTRLATAGFDGTVAVWDTESGSRQVQFQHDAQVGGARFSPDGRHVLATVSQNQGSRHSLQIYTLDLDELISIARATVTRGLTGSGQATGSATRFRVGRGGP